MKNAVTKSILIILALFLCMIIGTAQTTCDLTSKSSTLLLNLQIGMSPEQAQNVFGKALKIKIKKKGERTFFQNYIKTPAPEPLRGVRALYLRFYDRQLYQFEIFYEPRGDLTTLEDITSMLSAQLNLPANWEIKNNHVEIKCAEISLVADNILNPRFEVTNEIIRARIVKLREKEEK